MYILYNILILIVLVVFIIPYYTYRLFTEKGFGLRFKQSLGCVDEKEIAKVTRKDCIWIHGASVGEIVATSPLVKQIKKELPDRPVLVSAFTVGGYNMAKHQSDTGKQIMTALIDAVREQEGNGIVKRLSHHNFVTLLMDEAACCGCIVRDRYSGESLTLPADAVIIATGGMHGLFGDTTGSLFNTGAVTAELFRLGVPMCEV